MSKGIMSSRGLEGLQGTQMLPKFQNMPQMAFGNNPMFMPQKPMSLFGNYGGMPMQPPMQQPMQQPMQRPMQPPMQPPIQRPIDIPGKQPLDIFIEQQPMVPKPQSLLNPPQLSQMQKPQNPMSIGRLPINLFR
jgi:hypothetical protein